MRAPLVPTRGPVLRARPRTVLSPSEGLDGQVCLVGTAALVEGTDPLEAAFTGRPAVVAGYEVEEPERRYDPNTRTTSRT